MATITKELLHALRSDLNAAIATIGTKHGVALSAGSASFNENTATMKLTIVNGSTAATGKSAQQLKAEHDWKAQAALWGFKQEQLGTTITVSGKQYTILGLMPRRSKFPILALKQDGSQVLLPAEVLQ